MDITAGIHIGHDGGCAIMRDGEVVVACSEERLTRRKYSNGWWHSLRYCLDAAELRLDDIDLVVFSNAGDRLPEVFDGGLSKWTTRPLTYLSIDHHMSHAVGAFAFSPYQTALVFVSDAGGNEEITESAYLFDNRGHQRVLRSDPMRSRCKGLGTTYEAFTNFLGFSDQESGKTMGLAAYGDPEAFGQDIFTVLSQGEVSSLLAQPHFWGVVEASKRLNLGLGDPFPDSNSQHAKNIAAMIQKAFMNAQREVVSALQSIHGRYPIVLSGGTALNCVANTHIATLFGEVYAFPACSDAGLPLGNAVYGQLLLTGELPRPRDVSFQFGKIYSDEEIYRALTRHPDTVPSGGVRMGDLRYSAVEDYISIAADALADGKLVAWWQGKSEFGPRALGGRSILASTTVPGIREKINESVKRREWFRPFGPSVLLEEAPTLISSTRPFPYMIEAPLATSRGKLALGDCVHVDGSVRAQTVANDRIGPYRALLEAVRQRTGIGAVLNTSFNIQEPIVETPGDAIATFLRSRLDLLVLDRFVCTRV